MIPIKRIIQEIQERPIKSTVVTTVRISCTKIWGMFDIIYFYLFERPQFYLWVRKNKDKDLNLPCIMPFSDFEVFPNGDCYICCPGWLPIVVGNIKRKPINKIFNSMMAQRVRMAIYKGYLKYCRKDLCIYVNSPNFKRINKKDLSENNIITEETKTDILNRKLVFRDGPSRLSENITEVCNIRCNFCRSDFRKEDEQISNPFYEYLRHNQNRIKLLSFSGGEPFINRRVKETLREFQDSGVLFYFTSNLSYLDEEMRELLKKIKIWALHASLNAASRETYKKVCGKDSWEKVLKDLDFVVNLRNNSTRRFYFQISMVVTNQNYKEIVEFAKLGVSKDVDRIIYYPMGETPGNKHLQIGNKEKEEIKQMLEHNIFSKEKHRMEVEALKSLIESGI